MGLFTIFIFCCLVQSVWSRSSLQASSFVYDVVDYGAVGDGRIDDSKAFIKTWEAMCAAGGNYATYKVPTKSFMSSYLHFKGPCKAKNIHVLILGKIIAPVKSRLNTYWDSWISFSKINGLTVDGLGGEIDGSGGSWWSCGVLPPLILKGCNRPTSLKFHACNNLNIHGISSVNSPSNHISINACNGVTVSNVNLKAPGDSPNTDGIDISQSSNIMIRDSFIGTGDDCIAINSQSSVINITNIKCGPGHGISVGSLGADGFGVHDVHVSRCNLTGTKNGVRIKTFKNGSGFAKSITFERITLNNVKNPIIIDQNYCAHGCVTKGNGVQVSNITYTGIHGTSADVRGIIFGCNPKMPCNNIILNDINIKTASGGPTTSTCENVHGIALSTVPTVPCLKG